MTEGGWKHMISLGILCTMLDSQLLFTIKRLKN